MSHIYCQECGFQNPEAANYCARCGALLVKDEGGTETTQTFTPDEGEDTSAEALEDLTVSRKHAVIVQRDGGFFVEDQGSLNGTFVNRKRVESAQLEDGDELQIGKYRLTFLDR